MTVPPYARPYRSPLARWWLWVIVLVLGAGMSGVYDRYLAPPDYEVTRVSFEGHRFVAVVTTDRVLTEAQVRYIGLKFKLKYLDNPNVGARSLRLTFCTKGQVPGKPKAWAVAATPPGAGSDRDLEVVYF